MATIDSAKISSTRDAVVAQQPSLAQARTQTPQQTPQPGMPTPDGGSSSQTLAHGATTPPPDVEPNKLSRGSYNSGTPLSNVLPPDGGMGETTLAGGAAAIRGWLNQVDIIGGLLALDPLTDGNLASMQPSGAEAGAPSAVAGDSCPSSSGFDAAWAPRVVSFAVDSPEYSALREANGLVGPSDSNAAQPTDDENDVISANVQQNGPTPQGEQASADAQPKTPDLSQVGDKTAGQVLDGDRPDRRGVEKGVNAELAAALEVFFNAAADAAHSEGAGSINAVAWRRGARHHPRPGASPFGSIHKERPCGWFGRRELG